MYVNMYVNVQYVNMDGFVLYIQIYDIYDKFMCV